ncbi:hypothetical protein QZH41_017265, partial [Actinostola sp. cb2023]
MNRRKRKEKKRERKKTFKTSMKFTTSFLSLKYQCQRSSGFYEKTKLKTIMMFGNFQSYKRYIDLFKILILLQTADKLLDTGLKTLQSTLLLKKQVEVEKVQENLEIKRLQFAERMRVCKEKEEELKKKQLQIRDRVSKFEKFIKENDAKRRRAIQKYQTELKLKNQKTMEQDSLSHELEMLRLRNSSLQNRISKYSVYERFLLKVIDIVPDDYLETSDSMIMGLMMRFKTLSATNETLINLLTDRADEVENLQQKLQEMNHTHTQNLVLINSELACLQEQLEDTIQKNAELDQHLINRKMVIRQQSETLGRIKLAIDNLAERCQRKVLVPVETQDFDTKLSILQEHVKEYSDIVFLARPSETASTTEKPNTTLSSPSILKRESRLPNMPKMLKFSQETSRRTAGSHMKSGPAELRFADGL